MAFAVALLATLLLTPAVAWAARRLGWLDRPDGQRKLHGGPVPLLGGVAIWVAFVGALLVLRAAAGEAAFAEWGIAPLWLPLIVTSGAIVLLGAVDDVRRVSPWTKLAVQAAAGLYLYLAGLRIDVLSNPLGGGLQLGWLALPITLLWFAAMSNAFNLIDGLDGLAAGVGLVATVPLLVVAVLNGQPAGAVLAAALAGALLGFLRYNFTPARIFLGDSGSLLIGFLLASLAAMGNRKGSAIIALSVPILTLALPLFDVALAIFRRAARGRRIFRADHDHIHHRLLRLGLTPLRAVLSLYLVSVLSASLALVVATGPSQTLWAVFLLVGLLAWAGVRRLGYVEITELQRVLTSRLLYTRRTLTRNIRLVQLGEDLSRAGHPSEFWDRLVAAADELGMERLEMRLGASQVESRLSEQPPRSPYPVWGQAPADERAGTWTLQVPLLLGERRLGEVYVSFATSPRGLDFDSITLVQAIEEGFQACAHQDVEAAPSPARSVAPERGVKSALREVS